jgi:single-strand DNA-binding protein
LVSGSSVRLSAVPNPVDAWEVIVSRSLNKVQLIGNLGADPEVRSTNNGSRVATLSVATSRQWTGKGGDKQEKTEWHRVILWNSNYSKLADIAEKYCKKGDKVYVEGEIEYRTWQDREGQTRYTTEIRGRELILLGGRGGSGEDSYTSSKVGAAASAPKKDEAFDDFPEAMDGEDDDLPF